jgi:hypothetical protein
MDTLGLFVMRPPGGAVAGIGSAFLDVFAVILFVVFFGLVVRATFSNVAGGTNERVRAGTGFRTQLIAAGREGHGVDR